MKRILTIQDISCLGKCSVTATLPLVSAMGVECTILPTALLSSHTMFPDPYVQDLGDCLAPIARHWKQLDVHFDAIYTGYLGTGRAVQEAGRIFSMFAAPDTLLFVDPVMGDHGRLYSGFDSSYIRWNTELCRQADILVPNITEACLMAGMEYPDPDSVDERFIRTLLCSLARRLGWYDGPDPDDCRCAENSTPPVLPSSGNGSSSHSADTPASSHFQSERFRSGNPHSARLAVLTGVSLSPGKTGVYGMAFPQNTDGRTVSGMAFPQNSAGRTASGMTFPQNTDSSTASETASVPESFFYQCDRIPVSCHGTGDIFSSVSAAALMRGLPAQEAFRLAADYTALTIKESLMQSEAVHEAYDDRFGVAFEQTIPWLTARAAELTGSEVFLK